MSSTDRGSQDVTFDFKHPLQGKEFNKLLRGAIKHGIYQGGAVSITSDGSVAPGSNNAITIQPFQTVMNSGTDKLVNIATSASLQLTCNDTSGPQSASDTLLVMRYVWDDVIQNYIDFEYEDESTYVVLDTDVVVCKITYSAYPTISALDTTVRTSGIFDDDYNLVVENTAKTDTISERTLNTGINMGGSALFVDQANTRVGINDASPSYSIDVDGTGRITDAVILGSTLAVNGASITTTQTTFNLINATTTTLNIGGGATTAVNIGNASGTTVIAGTLGVTNDFAVATNKFTVTASNGNTVIAGTLDVAGDVTINTNKFTVTATSGDTTIGGTLDLTSDFTINTNKFTVTASNGNTVIAGTLGVTGITTLTELLNANGGIAVDTSNFTVNGTTGAVYTASTLQAVGITTLGTANVTDMNATTGHITTLDGAMNCSTQIMTNVNIDSGAIDATTIGASTQSSGKFTTITASSTLNVTGTTTLGTANITTGNITTGNITSGKITTLTGNMNCNNYDMANVDINSGNITASTGYFTTGYISTLAGSMNCNNHDMTNVDINSGAITGTTISGSTGSFTTLVGSSGIDAGGLGTYLKVKYFTGTMPTAGNNSTFAHGVTASKIHSMSILVLEQFGNYMPPNFDGTGWVYNYYIDGSYIFLDTPAASTYISGRAYKMLITYEP